MFIHTWVPDTKIYCRKCENEITKNSVHLDDDERLVFCDPCFLVLKGDIEKLVREFAGENTNLSPVITSDKIISLLKK